MDKEDAVYIWVCMCVCVHTRGILISHKEERNFAIYRNVDGPRGYYS